MAERSESESAQSSRRSKSLIPWRLPLRARAMVAFGGMALAVSVLLALVCYEVTRVSLITQRERVAERQAFVNARVLDSALTSNPDDPAVALRTAQTTAPGYGLLRVGEEWLSSSVTGDPSVVSQTMIELLDRGEASRQRLNLEVGPVVAVGVPLVGAADEVVYVELVPMDEVSESLNRLRRALTIATLATMAVGVAAGWWVSGRILRPVRRTAEAANLISQGALDRRLESDGDADLDPLVQSFNQMVDGLQLRIEREARFASDVSHELRTPLAAMLAALSIARRRVTEPAGIEALSMLQGEVDRFSDLITDLLEISRVEAGVAELNVEEVSPRRLMTGVLESLDHQDIPVTIDSNTPAMVSLDSRRITQVLTNLIQNADHYAGGATHIYLSGSEEMLEIVIDDDGPGIALEDRVHLFERFIRGKDVSVAGTGLGLALVKEHVRLHGGSVEVDDAPGGGARFLIHLPREPKK